MSKKGLYVKKYIIMRRKNFWFAGAAVLVILIAVYHFLGGFNKAKLSLVSSVEYTLAGYDYRGKHRSEALEKYFTEIRDMVKEQPEIGVLAMVYYKEPQVKGDNTHLFIGIVLNEGQSAPEQLEKRTIEAERAVRATVNAHAAVMPAPNAIHEKMTEFAQREGLTLQAISIEKYISETHLEIDMPVE